MIILDVHSIDNEPFVTVRGYWECHCEDNFVHIPGDPECLRCGDIPQDSPDARLNNALSIMDMDDILETWEEFERLLEKYPQLKKGE